MSDVFDQQLVFKAVWPGITMADTCSLSLLHDTAWPSAQTTMQSCLDVQEEAPQGHHLQSYWTLAMQRTSQPKSEAG